MGFPLSAVERAMQVRDVLMRAMNKEYSWLRARPRCVTFRVSRAGRDLDRAETSRDVHSPVGSNPDPRHLGA